MNLEMFEPGINEMKNELAEQTDFIRVASNNPVLLFTSANRYLKNNRTAIFHAVKNQAHNFQEYLAQLANEYVQEYAISHNIEVPFIIKLRNRNHFPSIFAIYSGEIEVMQFNIYEQWYGIREPVKDENSILLHNEQLNKEMITEISRENEEIDKWNAIKNSPFKGTHDYYHRKKKKNLRKLIYIALDNFYIIFRKEKLIDFASEQIQKCEIRIQEINDRYSRRKISVEEYFERNKIKKELINKFTEFFELHKFTVQSERSKLY